MRSSRIALASLCLGITLQQQAVAGQWSAGPLSLLQASPYVGGESGVLFVPAVAYQGEKLTVRGPFVDYSLYNPERNGLAVSLTLGLGPNQLETDDDPSLLGIEDRDSGLMAGVRVQHPWMQGTAVLAMQTDITNKSQGQRLTASWNRPIFSPNPRKFIFTTGVKLTWESEDYANYYYGISAQEAQNSVYSKYSVGQVFQPSITAGGYYNFTKNWQMIYNLELQVLSSDVKDSPIVDQSSVMSGMLGVVYHF